MLTDLERLQQILHPDNAFLITREQLEEAQKIVDALIKEAAWKSTENEWPEEVETVMAIVDGESKVAFWQDMAEGEWEVGYHHYRQWFYMNDDSEWSPIEYGYPREILWKPLPKTT